MIKQFYTVQLPAFLQLIRWRNLVILALTLYVLFNKWSDGSTGWIEANFYLCVVTAVLIAGAGNVINDYYDQEIDKINKPQLLLVGKIFTPKQTIWIYLVMNTLALTLTQNTVLLMLFSFSILLFWFYSYRLKKILVIGNLTVAFLSFYAIISGVLFLDKDNSLLLFAEIAFIIQFLREIIKDMEDVDGDKIGHCRTLPLVIGQQKTKIVLYVFSVLLVLTLLFWQLQFDRQIWSFYAVYYLLAVFVVKVYRANHKTHFSFLSSLLKMMMLIGLSSVIFVS